MEKKNDSPCVIGSDNIGVRIEDEVTLPPLVGVKATVIRDWDRAAQDGAS